MKVSIEQVNVSDDNYLLVEVLVTENQFVETGDHILTYESSKAAEEVEAVESGYVSINPSIEIGKEYEVGYTLLEINEEYKLFSESSNSLSDEKINEKKFSKKAIKKISELNIDISKFSDLEFVTESDVEALAAKGQSNVLKAKDFEGLNFKEPFNKIGDTRLAVIGAGNAALQLYDAVYSTEGQTVTKFFDMQKTLEYDNLLGIPIQLIQDFDAVKSSFDAGEFDEIIISFSGDIDARSKVFSALSELNIPFANVVHKNAEISPFSAIGKGNLILSGVRIGPFSSIGDNNIISARCSIEHNNTIGSGNTFGPYFAFSGSCFFGAENRF